MIPKITDLGTTIETTVSGTVYKTEDPDSIEVGNSKTGKFKVYGDASDQVAFRKKLDNALDLVKYANDKLGVGEEK